MKSECTHPLAELEPFDIKASPGRYEVIVLCHRCNQTHRMMARVMFTVRTDDNIITKRQL